MLVEPASLGDIDDDVPSSTMSLGNGVRRSKTLGYTDCSRKRH